MVSRPRMEKRSASISTLLGAAKQLAPADLNIVVLLSKQGESCVVENTKSRNTEIISIYSTAFMNTIENTNVRNMSCENKLSISKNTFIQLLSYCAPPKDMLSCLKLTGVRSGLAKDWLGLIWWVWVRDEIVPLMNTKKCRY